MGYFLYGTEEIEYLKKKDKKLGNVIEQLGMLERECNDDLFETVVNSILGQQISTKAHQALWKRIKDDLGDLDAEKLLALGRDKLQAYGTTWRKVDYIMEFARKVHDGEFDLQAVYDMEDQEAITYLCSLKGIGVWTAEMLLLFCLQRPDILSFGDLGVVRGMRMVYRHKEISKERFERYRRRLSPYGSVASLYFWAVSAGAVEGLTDPAGR